MFWSPLLLSLLNTNVQRKIVNDLNYKQLVDMELLLVQYQPETYLQIQSYVPKSASQLTKIMKYSCIYAG